MTPLPRGLWVILATPFDDEGQVDHESMVAQVRLAQEAGADGLVALGVFGEAASLALAEQRAVAETVGGAAGETPLVLGVSGRSTPVVIEQAESAIGGASAGGADRGRLTLMVQANSGAPAVVTRHLTDVHEATGLGIVLQDYPVASGVSITIESILTVLEACAFVTAVKAEAPPTPVAIGRLTAGTVVPVFGGLGGVGLVDELAMGAAGAMTGFSHPEGLRATLDAFDAGGYPAARAALAPWLPLANFEGQAGIALALRKTLLHRRGVIATPAVRPPAPTMPEELSALLDDHLASAPHNDGGDH